jgi:hypothetical protein
MTSTLTRDDARAIARVLYAVHQRRAARLAAEQQQAPGHRSAKANEEERGRARV